MIVATTLKRWAQSFKCLVYLLLVSWLLIKLYKLLDSTVRRDIEEGEEGQKILMQLINHHKKTVEAAKNKVSRDVQMLNLFITMVSQLLIKLYKFMIRFSN
jgi:hypothetical protein